MASNFTSICSYICNPLIIAGIIILITSYSSSNLYGVITGYAFILSGLIGFIILFLGISSGSSKYGIDAYTIFSMIPILILIGILIFLINSLNKYYNNIVNKQISSEYYTFSNIFVVITILEFILIYMGSVSKEFHEKMVLPKLNILLLYFLSILSILSAYNINIILKYYTTDGFLNRLQT